jgi:hypothetical protein
LLLQEQKYSQAPLSETTKSPASEQLFKFSSPEKCMEKSLSGETYSVLVAEASFRKDLLKKERDLARQGIPYRVMKTKEGYALYRQPGKEDSREIISPPDKLPEKMRQVYPEPEPEEFRVSLEAGLPENLPHKQEALAIVRRYKVRNPVKFLEVIEENIALLHRQNPLYIGDIMLSESEDYSAILHEIKGWWVELFGR